MPNWVERNGGLINKWWKLATVDDADIVAVWQGIGANSELDSYVNLVNPGINDLTIAAGTPTWTQAGGWSFDGSSYFDTSIIASENQTIMIMYVDAITDPAERIMGVDDTVTPVDFYIQNRSVDQPSTALDVTTIYFYGTSSQSRGPISGIENTYVVVGLNKSRTYHSLSATGVSENSFTGWSNTTLTHYIGTTNGNITANWTNSILAIVVYDRALTASEMTQVANAMLLLTSADSPNPNVNYIAIHPKTRHLSSAGHILLAALDIGIFRTENGGRQWGKIELPDPSNAEFGDVPAATVDELVFDWIDYDPLDTDTIYCRGLKTSLSRMWIYKSEDDGETWTSRGVVAT